MNIEIVKRQRIQATVTSQYTTSYFDISTVALKTIFHISFLFVTQFNLILRNVHYSGNPVFWQDSQNFIPRTLEIDK